MLVRVKRLFFGKMDQVVYDQKRTQGGGLYW